MPQIRQLALADYIMPENDWQHFLAKKERTNKTVNFGNKQIFDKLGVDVFNIFSLWPRPAPAPAPTQTPHTAPTPAPAPALTPHTNTNTTPRAYTNTNTNTHPHPPLVRTPKRRRSRSPDSGNKRGKVRLYRTVHDYILRFNPGVGPHLKNFTSGSHTADARA